MTTSVEIGALVEPVHTWDPQNSSDSPTFTYIDLGAVDQETKCITGARVILAADAPSRARQLVSVGDVLVSTVRPNLNGVARVYVFSLR
jgi:type I restriction enzyme S subunit